MPIMVIEASPIIRRQVVEIVAHSTKGVAREIGIMQRENKPFTAIVKAELADVINRLEGERSRERWREPLYGNAYVYGVFAVHRLIMAQLQDEMEIYPERTLPTVTQEAYDYFLQERNNLHHESLMPVYAREEFLFGMQQLEAESPELFAALNTISEGVELHGNKRTDFFGGAAFAYTIMRNAMQSPIV